MPTDPTPNELGELIAIAEGESIEEAVSRLIGWCDHEAKRNSSPTYRLGVFRAD